MQYRSCNKYTYNIYIYHTKCGYLPDFVSATQTTNKRAAVTPQRCWKLVGAALPRAMSSSIGLEKKR